LSKTFLLPDCNEIQAWTPRLPTDEKVWILQPAGHSCNRVHASKKKEGAFMAQILTKHTHKFSIADDDAVRVLLEKLRAPNGTHDVDEEKIYQALDSASRRYSHSSQEIGRAFFHGLLTGYAVGLKHT
jgi:hypothetical protein